MADAALGQLERIETIEQAYDAWRELKLEHAAFLSRCTEERRKIEQQGEFLVGAVRAATQLGAAPGFCADAEHALAERSGDGELAGYLHEAEEKIRAARETLERDLVEQTRIFDDALARIRSEVESRIARLLQGAPPRIRLLLRPVAGGRTLLHIERVSPDEAVLLLCALTGRIPSRYGFLFDDSTDDVMQPPQPLYPDEGVTPEQTRPDPVALRALAESADRVLPVKGFIPLQVPRAHGGHDFVRLLQRGPVMEAEIHDGAQFRNLLTREEGERLAGYLLRLKLAKKIDLEFSAG